MLTLQFQHRTPSRTIPKKCLSPLESTAADTAADTDSADLHNTAAAVAVAAAVRNLSTEEEERHDSDIELAVDSEGSRESIADNEKATGAAEGCSTTAEEAEERSRMTGRSRWVVEVVEGGRCSSNTIRERAAGEDSTLAVRRARAVDHKSSAEEGFRNSSATSRRRDSAAVEERQLAVEARRRSCVEEWEWSCKRCSSVVASAAAEATKRRRDPS